MNESKTLALILFVIISTAISGAGSNPRTQEGVGTLPIPRGLDHAKEFVEFLRMANLRVEEVQQSHFTGFLGSQKMAALIRTDKGIVEVVFLEGVAAAEKIRITYEKGSGSRHIYTFNADGITSKNKTINAAYPVYITLHNNWIIITLDCELESTIKRALHQTNRSE